MADYETGPLLVTLDDGTKIYSEGIVDSRGFIKAKVGVFSYGATFNPNTGKWNMDEVASFSTKLPLNTSLSFKPDGDGMSVTGTYTTPTPIQFGLAVMSNGDVVPVLAAGLKLGDFGFSAGYTIGDDGTNLAAYNTVTVSPDGKVRVTEHSSSTTDNGVDVLITTYDQNGEVVREDLSYIGDPDLAESVRSSVYE